MLNMDYYKKYMNCHNSNNFKEYQIKDIGKTINNTIAETINGFNALINSNRADSIFKNGIEYKCVIDYKKKWRKSDINPLWKEVWIQHNIINTGDMLQVQYRESKEKNDCLVVSNMDTREGHDVLFIQPCNHTLKWIDKNGEIYEHLALVNNEQLYTTGVTENKFIQWGNSKESILLPSNEITQTIYEDLRLIINRHCWKVTFINEDHKGLLKIMCEQDEFNKEYDNKELGIADYYLYKNTYDFKILNKNPILVTKDNSVEINPQCYKNSTIHSNPQIDYKISDEDIIKIENNKIIGLKNGNCTLEIQYANIKKSINVNVIEQETNNTVIEIDGKKKIAWGNKGAYTITLKNNGQEYTDKVEFMLTDKNNKSTELAKIIDKNNQSCTIQANDKQNDGIVILHCKDRVGNEETMEINICSFWLVGR